MDRGLQTTQETPKPVSNGKRPTDPQREMFIVRDKIAKRFMNVQKITEIHEPRDAVPYRISVRN